MTNCEPINLSLKPVIFTALLLALLTDWEQFFAIDRHSRWLDVGIYMVGAMFGVAMLCELTKMFPAHVLPE